MLMHGAMKLLPLEVEKMIQMPPSQLAMKEKMVDYPHTITIQSVEAILGLAEGVAIEPIHDQHSIIENKPKIQHLVVECLSRSYSWSK